MALHIIAAVIIGGLHSWPHWVQMFLTISCCRNLVLNACTTCLSRIQPLHYQHIRYVHQHYLYDYCGHSMLTTLQQACWMFFYSDSHTHLWNGYTAVKHWISPNAQHLQRYATVLCPLFPIWKVSWLAPHPGRRHPLWLHLYFFQYNLELC